jgi:FtsZ-interacting cell division protein YlmF
VLGLPAAEKDSLLEKFIQDESRHLCAELLKRFRQEYRNKPENRTDTADRPFPTVGQLRREAEELRAEREREETQRRDREKKEKEEKAAAERRRYLENLAVREEETWGEIESLVSTKQPRNYDQSCQLLTDLFDLSTEQGKKASFAERIQDLRIRHRRKKSFIDRLNQAGLPSSSPSQDKDSDL